MYVYIYIYINVLPVEKSTLQETRTPETSGRDSTDHPKACPTFLPSPGQRCDLAPENGSNTSRVNQGSSRYQGAVPRDLSKGKPTKLKAWVSMEARGTWEVQKTSQEIRPQQKHKHPPTHRVGIAKRNQRRNN